MRLYGSLCVLMVPFMWLCVIMDSKGSLWVLIDPQFFLRIPMGPYGSL